MVKIAYHASQEQFPPSALLHYADLAERTGFHAIHSSDHFQPWNERQGQSGHTLSWLGAAMRTSSLPFGLICAPGPRHHPAIVAQAIATLGEMFPGRLWIALGSGEAINERPVDARWPSKSARNGRLLESFHIIKQLLAGNTVSSDGFSYLKEARLYTLPAMPPRVFGAAISEETAHWMGGWAEGLLTVGCPLDRLKRVIERFGDGGGIGKPIYVKVQLSYARSRATAYADAFQQWRTNILDNSLLAELWQPAQFEAAARFVKPEDLNETVYISNEPQQHIEWLKAYNALDIDTLILHNVNREQETFIRDFGEKVIPLL